MSNPIQEVAKIAKTIKNSVSQANPDCLKCKGEGIITTAYITNGNAKFSSDFCRCITQEEYRT